MKRPFFSIWVVTYNHKKYIYQVIEEALEKRTSFPIEIFIWEDESNAGTREICIKYTENIQIA